MNEMNRTRAAFFSISNYDEFCNESVISPQLLLSCTVMTTKKRWTLHFSNQLRFTLNVFLTLVIDNVSKFPKRSKTLHHVCVFRWMKQQKNARGNYLTMANHFPDICMEIFRSLCHPLLDTVISRSEKGMRSYHINSPW